MKAPAIIKAGDTYFGVSPVHRMGSESRTQRHRHRIMGYWEPGRNFAIDNGAATTYRSQSTLYFQK